MPDLRLYLHWRRLQFPAAASRAWRLGIDRRDLVGGIVERRQRRHRELGRSHEDDAHYIPLWRKMG